MAGIVRRHRSFGAANGTHDETVPGHDAMLSVDQAATPGDRSSDDEQREPRPMTNTSDPVVVCPDSSAGREHYSLDRHARSWSLLVPP